MAFSQWYFGVVFHFCVFSICLCLFCQFFDIFLCISYAKNGQTKKGRQILFKSACGLLVLNSYFCASNIRSCVIFSIDSTQQYSYRPWKLWPPAHRFGHGMPIKESLAPSVPPRIGWICGSMSSFFIHVFTFSIKNRYGSI